MNKKYFLLIILGIFIIPLLIWVIFYSSNKESTNKKAVVKEASEEKIISDRVLQFYKFYKLNSGSLDTAHNEGYITSENFNVLKQVNAYDPVLCTQGGSQSPILIDKITMDGSNATVLVKQYYEGSKSYNFIKLTIRLSDQKITSIECARS